MGLMDRINAQERRREEMEQVLNRLAREFADQMVTFGIRPSPVMDTTGEYNVEQGESGGWDYSVPIEIITVHCYPTGVEAWSLKSANLGEALLGSSWRILAITTDGKLMVTEAAHSRGSTSGHRYEIEGTEESYVLVPYSLSGIHDAPSWGPARDRWARNTFIDWAERAHVEGVEVITEPIELAMLHEVNELRKR